MSGTYTNLLYHIVFSTKERRQLITPAIEDELFSYIGGIILVAVPHGERTERECHPIRMRLTVHRLVLSKHPSFPECDPPSRGTTRPEF
jgi:hypothetical protein